MELGHLDPTPVADLRDSEHGAGEEVGPRLGRKSKSPWGFFRDFPRTLPYVKRYWRLAATSFALIGVSSLFSLLSPWPLAILLDSVLGNKPLPAILGPLLGGVGRYPLLVFAVVAGLLVTAASHGVGILDNYVNTKLGARLTLDFRSDLFEHAQKLSMAFHDSAAKGLLMFRINNQAESIGEITTAIPPLAQAAFTLVGMFVIAYRIDHELALVSLTVVPFVYYSAGYYAKRIQPRLWAAQGLEVGAMSIIYEALAMLRVITAFGRGSYEHRRFREQAERAVDARVKVTVTQTMFSLGVNMLTASGTALVLGIGALHVIHHQLTIGELFIVLGYIAAIYQPLEQISHSLTQLQGQFTALNIAFTLLDTEPDVKDAADARPLERVAGRVTFENVTFSYGGRMVTLEDISFDVAPGQRVAIVGQTGAGKTTLASLIMRFYDPKEGRILLDGTDIRTVTLDSLREQVSVVLQEPLLFSGPIYDNILYGRLEASEEEVFAAATSAGAHDFITQLPEGYQTLLGEGGAKISGGERQRISIARAFLKDAPILILDEPTSAIDSKTERVILDALDRLMEGRTTFVIAHRLSAIRGADVILVLDQGQLVERGTHEELLARQGLYHDLWEAHAGQAKGRTSAADEVRERAEVYVEASDAEEASENGASLEHALVLAARNGGRPAEDGFPAPIDGAPDLGRLVTRALGSSAAALSAALAAAMTGGDPAPLRALAARGDDASEQVRFSARLAGALLEMLPESRPRRDEVELALGAWSIAHRMRS